MEILKRVDDFNSCYLKGLTVLFKAVLSYGEEVSFTARYNEEGEMVDCSAPYSKSNNADYYIEIGKIFQAMKDIQGERVLDALIKAKEIEKEYKEKRLTILTEERKVIVSNYNELSAKYDELKGKCKRARSEENKTKLKVELDSISDEYSKAIYDYNLLRDREEEVLSKYYNEFIDGLKGIEIK